MRPGQPCYPARQTRRRITTGSAHESSPHSLLSSFAPTLYTLARPEQKSPQNDRQEHLGTKHPQSVLCVHTCEETHSKRSAAPLPDCGGKPRARTERESEREISWPVCPCRKSSNGHQRAPSTPSLSLSRASLCNAARPPRSPRGRREEHVLD